MHTLLVEEGCREVLGRGCGKFRVTNIDIGISPYQYILNNSNHTGSHSGEPHEQKKRQPPPWVGSSRAFIKPPNCHNLSQGKISALSTAVAVHVLQVAYVGSRTGMTTNQSALAENATTTVTGGAGSRQVHNNPQSDLATWCQR